MLAKCHPACIFVVYPHHGRATCVAVASVLKTMREDKVVQRPSRSGKPRQPTPGRGGGQKRPSRRSGNQMRVAYIIISGLVVCSMIAVAVSMIDFSGLWGDGDDEVIVDPNADIVAEQQTAVANDPDNVDEIVLLANMLSNTGRMSEATEQYERALDIQPDDHGIRLDFARSLQTNGLLADAEAQFLLVLEAEPDNLPAHYYLAKLYMGWEPPRQDEARDHFTRAIEINPDSFLAEQAQLELEMMDRSSPVATPESITPVAGP